jgi:hypothetical protein
MGKKFHGGGLTALLERIAKGHEGRVFVEIPAHEGGVWLKVIGVVLHDS